MQYSTVKYSELSLCNAAGTGLYRNRKECQSQVNFVTIRQFFLCYFSRIVHCVTITGFKIHVDLCLDNGAHCIEQGGFYCIPHIIMFSYLYDPLHIKKRKCCFSWNSCYSKQFVSATPLKPLNRISWNFVVMKDIMCRYAYAQDISIQFFLSELSPFLNLEIRPKQFVSATPLKLLSRISWNSVVIKDLMCRCAYPQEILIQLFFWE